MLCRCRGKQANTASIISYSLASVSAILAAILGYVYAKRALRRIHERVNKEDDDQQTVEDPVANAAAHGYNIDVVVAKHGDLVNPELLRPEGAIGTSSCSYEVDSSEHSKRSLMLDPSPSPGTPSKRRLLNSSTPRSDSLELDRSMRGID